MAYWLAWFCNDLFWGFYWISVRAPEIHHCLRTLGLRWFLSQQRKLAATGSTRLHLSENWFPDCMLRQLFWSATVFWTKGRFLTSFGLLLDLLLFTAWNDGWANSVSRINSWYLFYSIVNCFISVDVSLRIWIN